MKNRMTRRFRTHLSKCALLAFVLIGLLTSHANSQTTSSLTLRLSVVDTDGRGVPAAIVVLKSDTIEREIVGVTNVDGTVTFVDLQPGTSKVSVNAIGFAPLHENVTVSVNGTNDVKLAVGPPPPPDTNVSKIKSLMLPIPLRILRGLQYELKVNEQAGTVLITNEAGVLQPIENPQRNLQQHTLTFKWAELFPDAMSLYKRGNDYLNKNAPSDDAALREWLCGTRPLVTCLGKGGRWWERFFGAFTTYVNYSERVSVVQNLDVTAPRFGKKFQFNGGASFDPAKLFLTASSWKGAFDEVQKIDKATALLGARDAIDGTPWKPHWLALFLPKIDFKILSQFDFIKQDGILVEAPFRERALNTWTVTWDLTRLIPDTKNRLDADIAREALNKLRTDLGHKPPDPNLLWRKRCILYFAPGQRDVDVQAGFSDKSCQELAQLKTYSAQSYELACVQGTGAAEVIVKGGQIPAATPPAPSNKPVGVSCNW